MTGSDLQRRLDEFIAEEIDRGSFPSAAYAVGDASQLLVSGVHGYAVRNPRQIAATADTIYDLASLTKPLVTATLVAIAVAEQRISLDDPIRRWVPEVTDEKADLTLADLLTHRSGFQAWYPCYAEGRGRESYLRTLVRRPLRYVPRSNVIYSDLGYLLMTYVLERAYAMPLDRAAAERIFVPLKLQRTMFNPPPGKKEEIAATEYGNVTERAMVAQRGLSFGGFRDYIHWGEANDGNAFYLGGVGGNAGLFSTAREVWAIAKTWLTCELFAPEVRDAALFDQTPGLAEPRAIGWQIRGGGDDHPSAPLSDGSIGHAGFTGTSVWIDRERERVFVLLTNRLHPFVRPVNMQAIRRRFHEIAVF